MKKIRFPRLRIVERSEDYEPVMFLELETDSYVYLLESKIMYSNDDVEEDLDEMNSFVDKSKKIAEEMKMPLIISSEIKNAIAELKRNLKENKQ